jgi:hypothetical protein
MRASNNRAQSRYGFVRLPLLQIGLAEKQRTIRRLGMLQTRLHRKRLVSTVWTLCAGT